LGCREFSDTLADGLIDSDGSIAQHPLRINTLDKLPAEDVPYNMTASIGLLAHIYRLNGYLHSYPVVRWDGVEYYLDVPRGLKLTVAGSPFVSSTIATFQSFWHNTYGKRRLRLLYGYTAGAWYRKSNPQLNGISLI
jgi:hypothetical protein